VGIYKFFSLAE